MNDRIFTLNQLMFLIPLIILPILTNFFDSQLSRFIKQGKLWHKAVFAFLGFLFFGIFVGMLIGRMLPEGFLVSWKLPVNAKVARETFDIFSYNFVAYFLFIPIANLFKVRSVPYGLILFWTLAWGWGMVIGSNSLASANALTLEENLVGFLRITLWEFLAGSLTWAATSAHNRWYSPGWLKKGKRVENFSFKYTKDECIMLGISLILLLFAAWQESLSIAGL